MNSPLFGGEFIVVKAKTRKMQLIIPIFVKEGVRRTDIVVGTVPGGSGADLAAGFVDYAAVAERRDAGFNDFENIYTETRPLEIEQRNGKLLFMPAQMQRSSSLWALASRHPPLRSRRTVGAAAAEKAPIP